MNVQIPRWCLSEEEFEKIKHEQGASKEQWVWKNFTVYDKPSQLVFNLSRILVRSIGDSIFDLRLTSYVVVHPSTSLGSPWSEFSLPIAGSEKSKFLEIISEKREAEAYAKILYGNRECFNLRSPGLKWNANFVHRCRDYILLPRDTAVHKIRNLNLIKNDGALRCTTEKRLNLKNVLNNILVSSHCLVYGYLEDVPPEIKSICFDYFVGFNWRLNGFDRAFEVDIVPDFNSKDEAWPVHVLSKAPKYKNCVQIEHALIQTGLRSLCPRSLNSDEANILLDYHALLPKNLIGKMFPFAIDSLDLMVNIDLSRVDVDKLCLMINDANYSDIKFTVTNYKAFGNIVVHLLRSKEYECAGWKILRVAFDKERFEHEHYQNLKPLLETKTGRFKMSVIDNMRIVSGTDEGNKEWAEENLRFAVLACTEIHRSIKSVKKFNAFYAQLKKTPVCQKYFGVVQAGKNSICME